MNIKQFILYGLSVALNRGVVFILLPLAGYFLNLSDFGFFSLIIITSQLLVPIITLNISVVISREFLDSREFLEKYCSYMLCFLFLGLLFCLLVDINRSYIYLYVFSESLLMMLLTRARFYYGSRTYFLATLIKSFIFLLILATVNFLKNEYMTSIIFFCALLSLANFCSVIFLFCQDSFIRNLKYVDLIKAKRFFIENKVFVMFGLVLIPHSLSQWIMSSSDRYFVKIFFSDSILGQYSLAYSYASIFMLLISVLAIVLPEWCVRNHSLFISKKMFSKFILLSSLLYIISFVVLYSFITIILKFDDVLLNIFSIVYASLFFLCLYHYCSAIHFYHKKSIFITRTTLTTSVVSVLFSFSFLGKVIYLVWLLQPMLHI